MIISGSLYILISILYLKVVPRTRHATVLIERKKRKNSDQLVMHIALTVPVTLSLLPLESNSLSLLYNIKLLNTSYTWLILIGP